MNKIIKLFTNLLKIKLVLIAVFFKVYIVYSQELPKIIPPSPTAQTFIRYGEIPVDNSTGVPKIEIPLYTLQGIKLEVPISISYHASGIKVEDIASEVGLGWALNCGGLISRTINGKPDEHNNIRTFYNANELLDSLNEVAPLYDISNGNLYGIKNFEYFLNQNFINQDDPMSDRYFYSLPNGSSGSFTYDYYDVNENDESIILLPYRPIEIEKYVNSSKIDSFKVTDDDGTRYTFKPYVLNVNLNQSEWFLKSIVSADGIDTIKYNYVIQSAQPSISRKTPIYTGPPEVITTNCNPLDLLSNVYNSISQLTIFNTPILESISSKKAIVKFEYGSRNDVNLKKLIRITIRSAKNPNSIIRTIDFDQNYFGSSEADNLRLGLNDVVITAPGIEDSEKYSFIYEEQVLPKYFAKSNKNNEDFWGYYNGNNTSYGLPFDFISNSYDRQAYGANRNPDQNGYYSRACMLKEIKYPTGGKTTFMFQRNYSPNVYPNRVEKGGYIGGFRVQSITNYDEDGEVANLKTYEYAGAKSGQITKDYFSYDIHTVEKSTKTQSGISTSCWSTYSNELVFSNAILPVEVAAGLPIMYTMVTEYNGTIDNHAGKTVYEYRNPYSPTDYESNPDHPIEYELPWFYNTYHYDKGNFIPELKNQTVYSYDGYNYYPLYKEQNYYSAQFNKEFYTGIKLSRTRTWKDINYFTVLCPGLPCSITGPINEYLNSVVAIDTKAYQEASLITSANQYTYNPLDSTQFLQTSTNYTYNQENLAVKEKITITSKNEVIKTEYKYPHDFASVVPYSTMLNKHIYKPLIEETNYNVTQGTLINKIMTNYKDWGSNIIKPSSLQVQKGINGTLDTRINYLSYDSYGHMTSVKKANDAIVTYLWGYDGLYPIAEVLNVDYSTVANYVDLNFLKNATQYSDEQVRTELNKIRVGLETLGKPFSLKTFTYNLNYGITSKTDANGITIFYDYDNFGRLTSVRDNNENIFKAYNYHYSK